MKELPIPHSATTDPSARELARVWAAHGRQQVSLEVGLWNDPGAWGLLLVDLARHVAKAYEQKENRSAADVLVRIREAFDAEWSAPTDWPSGEVG